MENKKLYELKDDPAADIAGDLAANAAVKDVKSSLERLASTVTNIKDFSRVMKAIAKFLQKQKGSTLSTLNSDQNYKLVMTYLNKMQSDEDDKDKKQAPVEKSVVQKP